jgi:hypothetical protein
MANEHEQRRRQTDSRIKKFWHDWVPVLSICCSVLIGFGGAVWTVSTYKSSLEERLDKLKEGQTQLDGRMQTIEQQHGMMENKLDKLMFRLRIPIDDVDPEYHAWPQKERKGPDANLDKELDKLYKNDKHSSAFPPDPVLGLMQVPPPPQISGNHPQ